MQKAFPGSANAENVFKLLTLMLCWMHYITRSEKKETYWHNKILNKFSFKTGTTFILLPFIVYCHYSLSPINS